MAKNEKFIVDWISNLMKNMDNHLDEKTKINLLEECGRDCAKKLAKKEAIKNKGRLDKWLNKMGQWIGTENIWKEEKMIKIIYSQCFCPILKNSPPILSDTYCNCSRGWLKENFETVLERSVQVKLEDSILRGGKECRFTVFI